MQDSITKYIPFLIAIVLFLVVVGIIISLFLFNSSAPTKTTSSPAPSGTKIAPTSAAKNAPLVTTIPTVPEDQGGGIDTNSAPVQDSTTEIEKLTSALPYTQDVTLSTEENVSILINGEDLQNNEWTLKVEINGINYNTSPDQPDYDTEKQSFIEAANLVFDWIRQQGADPDKIIFIWGDKKYIQDQAVAWLQ